MPSRDNGVRSNLRDRLHGSNGSHHSTWAEVRGIGKMEEAMADMRTGKRTGIDRHKIHTTSRMRKEATAVTSGKCRADINLRTEIRDTKELHMASRALNTTPASSTTNHNTTTQVVDRHRRGLSAADQAQNPANRVVDLISTDLVLQHRSSKVKQGASLSQI